MSGCLGGEMTGVIVAGTDALAGEFCARTVGAGEADGGTAAGLALGREFSPPLVLESGVARAGVKLGRAPCAGLAAAGLAAGLMVGVAKFWAVARRLPERPPSSST